MKSYLKVWNSCGQPSQNGCPFNFCKQFSKIQFVWEIIFNFRSTSYLFYSMYIIGVKDNGTVANLGYINIWFARNNPSDMLFCHFSYFHFCNTDMSLAKKMNFPSITMLLNFMILKLSHENHGLLNFHLNLQKTVLFSITSKLRNHE